MQKLYTMEDIIERETNTQEAMIIYLDGCWKYLFRGHVCGWHRDPKGRERYIIIMKQRKRAIYIEQENEPFMFSLGE
jgi:hypothetical protein